MIAAFPLVRHDLRLQFRYGIHFAYGFVTAFYIGCFLLAGPYLPGWLPALIIYTDPAVVGFFFLGALMLLERNENVRLALAATPLRAADYVLAKTVTLTALGLVATLLVLPFAHPEADLLLLSVAVILTSTAFVGIGIGFGRRSRTVNAYLVGSAALLTPIIAPGFLALLPDMPLPVLLIPTAAQFRLILVALGAAPADPLKLALGLATASVTAAICLWWAIRDLQQEFGK